MSNLLSSFVGETKSSRAPSAVVNVESPLFYSPGNILRKSDFTFVSPTDGRLSFSGRWEELGECYVGHGIGASLTWSGKAKEVIAAVVRHPWSGVVELSSQAAPRERRDLYSWAWHVTPFSFGTCREAINFTATLMVTDQNVFAKAAQLALLGVFVKGDEPPKQIDHATVQTTQIQNWIEAVTANGESFIEIEARRKAAYLQRWKEAGPYILKNGAILDIGCGYFFDELFQHIGMTTCSYVGLDIDKNVIESNTASAHSHGERQRFSFVQGSNDVLPFGPEIFDFIFSSHSLEHSNDLKSTFSELHRVLKPDGFIFFAVPLGIDSADEHVWIVTQEQWISVTQEAGFRVRNVHIGDTYPENDFDLVVVAQKANR